VAAATERALGALRKQDRIAGEHHALIGNLRAAARALDAAGDASAIERAALLRAHLTAAIALGRAVEPGTRDDALDALYRALTSAPLGDAAE
jgi:hypothetical protein